MKKGPAESNAGPGCWQCAECGRVVSKKKEDCPFCENEKRLERRAERIGEKTTLSDW